MGTSVARTLPTVISADRRQAKADLRKAEWRAIGQAFERTRLLCGLSLKEFADALGRDDRQVARWIAALEPPQVPAVFAVARFQQAFVIALAEQVDGLEVVTEIRTRRSA